MSSTTPSSHRPQGFSLLVHTLAPTGVGAAISLLAAAALTIAHLVALSVSGTAYPEHLNDTLFIGYANFIIQPLLVLTNSTALNNFLTLALWAAAGSLVAALLGSIADVINGWRTARENVSMPRYGVVIHHPLQHSLIMRLIWRLVIGICIACYTILALFAVQYCFANDLRILDTGNTAELVWRAGASIGIWSLLLHGYIILLRLYLQRTRIFGEILY